MKKLLAALCVFTALFANAQTPGENIDVTHYEIHLNNLDFTSRTIDAVTTVTLTAKTSVNSIDLELKSLVVSDVTSSNANISGFTQNGDVLTINLSTAMAANATASFTISYGGNTFNDGWGGVLWSGGYVCNMGVGFESVPHNLGKCWFPCVDDFIDKATYEVHVTVPTELSAVCGGNLESTTDNGDGTKTVHYVVPQEIATYHISFVAGDYLEWTDIYDGAEHDIPITVYVKPNQINKVEGTFVNVKEIASYFENCYGPYPFNRIGYAITSVGCMEHIDNIGITSGILTGNTSQESYIAHEMSHMWFGNKITCASAEEMWLNEGFAQFCGLNYREAVYGEADYQDEMNSTIKSVLLNYDNTEGWLTLNNVPQDKTYGNTVYQKGATVVHTLRNYLGKELFNEAMRYYLDKFAFQSVTSEDLRDAITEYTGIDMTGFFDTYVFTCGEPHYVIDSVITTPNGSRFNVDIYTSQSHRHSDHIGDGVILELAFMNQDWDMVTDTIHWDGRTGHTVKTLDFEPIAVFGDYYNKALDARIDRNYVIKTTGKSTGINMEANTSEITDSTYLHIENHLVGPTHPFNNELEMKYPDEKYWTVFRDDKGSATINGVFTYAITNDPSIIQTENDSVVVIYRENASKPWRSLPSSAHGNWQVGKLTIAELLPGDYALASIDKTIYGTDEVSESVVKAVVTPNPATSQIKITTGLDSYNILIINSLGQTVNTFSVKEKEIIIPISDYKSGVYYINILDEKKNIISTEKMIKI